MVGLDRDEPGCGRCGRTHVLLAVSLAARRADAAAVIASAVEAKVLEGAGHRRIAAALSRPVSTVRGWLRAVSVSASAVSEAFRSLVIRDAPDAAALWPAPERDPQARALAVLAAYAAVLADRFGVGSLAWVRAGVRAGISATNGWLFSAPWWSAMAQHELALTPATAAGSGSG